MKMFLVGGTVIEVSDDDYMLVVTKEKAGFTLVEQVGKNAFSSVATEEYIVPRSIVERIELCKK